MTTPALEVYRDYMPAGKEMGLLPLVENQRVLEIGFGGGKLLEALQARGNDVHGVDASGKLVSEARAKGFGNVHLLDMSEEPLPFEDDSLDAVYAYEVFEHLTNPHRMFFEVRRCLKVDGLFFFSVPSQEIDMGYGPCRHTFVYPGLLEKENLERFIMQMYFGILKQIEPEPGQWLLGRNYILRNMKRAAQPDVVQAIIEDYNVRDRYGYLLTEEQLAREIALEVEPQLTRIEQCAAKNEWDWVLTLVKMVLSEYPEYHAMYPRLVEILLSLKGAEGGRRLASAIGRAAYLPEEIRARTDALLAQAPQASAG